MEAGNYYLTGNVTIYSTWKPQDGVVLCLNGYSISLDNNGPVIEVQPGVTFTLCDCNGSNNLYDHGITHYSRGKGRGAGVLVGKTVKIGDTAGKNDAVFNMYGGAIFGNWPWTASADNAASASGVLIGGGTFNMYGGKITENKLVEDGGIGGGVFVANQGSFNMSGGEISGNTAKEGGGVFVGGLYGHHDMYAFGGGTFTMTGGKISGNSVGGGVYVSAGSNTHFTVSGSAQITDNQFGVDPQNVYLDEDKGESNTITVDGTLDSTASIGVTVPTPKSGDVNQLVASNISKANAKHFFSDSSKYRLKRDSGANTLTMVAVMEHNHSVCGATCSHIVGGKASHENIVWKLLAMNSDGKLTVDGTALLNNVLPEGNYYLADDLELSGSIETPGYKKVNLDLNGNTLTVNDNADALMISSGASFTLCDCSEGQTGKVTHGENHTGCGVYVRNYSTFTMYGGSITGNNSSHNGGGVLVNSAGTFNMYGGSITGNTTTAYGGGVCLNSETSSGTTYKATFNMYGGSITNNAANSSNKSFGGGVYSQGTFTMTGGTITQNTAEYGAGVWTSTSFTVSGAPKITGNTKNNVYLSLSNITIGTEGLKPEAKIGVTTGNEDQIETGKSVTVATGATGSCTADNFTADAGGEFSFKVEPGTDANSVNVNLYNGLPHKHYRCNGKNANGEDKCTEVGHTEDTVLDFKPWTATDSLPTDSDEYYLTQDVTLDRTWSIKGTGSNQVRFVLCLNGHSIKLRDGASGNVIDVGANATLALCDCNGSNAGNGKITGSKASGVSIAYNGAFVMYGGSISGNGTGVNNNMLFHMYGGSITGNDRGVTVDSDDFVVAGNVTITDNTNSNVYLPRGKTIKVSGALTGGEASIGITTANAPAENAKVLFATGADNAELDYTKIFTPDVKDRGYVVSKGTGGSLFLGVHQHSWTYKLSVDGKTITAVCSDCNASGGSMTITPPTGSLTYDGNEKAAAVTGTIPGVTVPTITYKKGDKPLNAAPTDAGDYTASITLGEGENAKTASVTYTIKARNLDMDDIGLSWAEGADHLTYNGSEQKPDFTKLTVYDATMGNGPVLSAADYDITCNKQTNKGTYELTVTLKRNYSSTYGKKVTWYIDPREVTLDWQNTESRTYGDGKAVTATAAGMVNGDVVNVTVTGGDATAVGTHTATATALTGEKATNYKLPDANTQTYTIGQKTLTAADLEFTTGSTFTKVYDGKDTCETAAVQIKDNAKVNVGDTLPTVSGSCVYNSANVEEANTVTFTTKAAESENYSLPVLTVTHGASITKATPSYTVPTGLTAKYGQTLADIALPTGWSWIDSTQSVGDASTTAKTFKAKFTPADTANYNVVENIKLEVTVDKADGSTLKNVELAQKYTDTSERTYAPDWSGLPTGQNWSYNSEYSVSTGSVATLTKQDVAAANGKLTYAISGGKTGEKITITLKASCDNYEDFTITLVITLTAKDDQALLTLTGGTTVVYGQTLQLGTTGGTGTGAVTYAVTNGTGEATIDAATGKLTPVKVGTVTVTATKAADANYNPVTSAPVTITITKATPTGEPAYTKITTSGKTLADAALGIGTITPAGGTIAWDDPTTTEVVANKSYGWTYTPADTNYDKLTGTIKLWSKSSGGGGGRTAAVVAPDMPMLYRGCTGDAVKTLQEKLNAKGFDSGNVDGIFGAKTYAAVTAFQKANSLGVDGIVGKLTWAKLYDATPVNVTPVTTQPMLRTGSRGDAVRKLQELLNAKGYTCGSVDGIFGSKTYAAVLAFQKANGLAADGIVGSLTWGKLV